MKNGLLEDGCDPMGQAIRDYYETGQVGRLRVFSPQFDEDEMPVGTLFREEEDMPPLERKALDLCCGRVGWLPQPGLAKARVGRDGGGHLAVVGGRDASARGEAGLGGGCLRRGFRRMLRYGADADERFRHHRAAGTHALVFPSHEATVGTRRLRVGGFQ